jgi:predicted pyridoxine 5'-phosphate oxidase superfamily flavin-nucleotide-binding protein
LTAVANRCKPFDVKSADVRNNQPTPVQTRENGADACPIALVGPVNFSDMKTPVEISAAIEANVEAVSTDRISWDNFSCRQREFWKCAELLGIADKVGALLTVNRNWRAA